MKTYFIKDGYQHRLDNKYFDDTENTDKWQREVYTFARDVAVKITLPKSWISAQAQLTNC